MAVERSPRDTYRQQTHSGLIDVINRFNNLARLKLVPGRPILTPELQSPFPDTEKVESTALLDSIAEKRALKADEYSTLQLSAVYREGLISTQRQKIHASVNLRKAILAANPGLEFTPTGKKRKETVVQRKIDREIGRTIKAVIKGDEPGIKLTKWVQNSIRKIDKEQTHRKSEVRKRGARLREVRELDKWASYIQNPDPVAASLRNFKALGRQYQAASDQIQFFSGTLNQPSLAPEKVKTKIEDSLSLQHLRRAGLEFDLGRIGQAIPRELLGARARSNLEWRLLRYAQARGDITKSELVELKKISTFARVSRPVDAQFNYGRWIPLALLTFLAGTYVGFTHRYISPVEASGINFPMTPIVRATPLPSSALQLETPRVEVIKTPTPVAVISEKLKATLTTLKTALTTPLGTPTPSPIGRFAEQMRNIAKVLETPTVTRTPVATATETRRPTITTQPRTEAIWTATATRPAATATAENSPTSSPTVTTESTKTPTNTPTKTAVPPTATVTETKVPPTATSTRVLDTATPAPTKEPTLPPAETKAVPTVPVVVVKAAEQPESSKEDKKAQEVPERKYSEVIGNLRIYEKESVSLWVPRTVRTFDVQLNGRAPSVTAAQIRKELLERRSPYVDYAEVVYKAGVDHGVDPAMIMSAWLMENGYTNKSYWNNPGSIVYVGENWLPGMSLGAWNHNRRWASFPTFADGIRAIGALIAKDYFKHGQTDLWSIHSGIEGTNGRHAYHGWGDAHSEEFFRGFYSNWLDAARRIASYKV